MIVVVTGGRTFGEGPKAEIQRFLLREVLNDLHHGIGRAEKGIDLLIDGGADGADTLASGWAQYHGVPGLTVAAKWRTEGAAAGPLRNERMLRLAMRLAPVMGGDLHVVAFTGGNGTDDCVRRAKALKLNVIDHRGGEDR